MNAFFKVEDCPEPVVLPGPDLRKVKHTDYMDNSDEDSYEDDENLFKTVTLQPNKPQLQVRANRGQQSKIWKHYIAAEEVTWDYAPHLKPTDR